MTVFKLEVMLVCNYVCRENRDVMFMKVWYRRFANRSLVTSQLQKMVLHVLFLSRVRPKK